MRLIDLIPIIDPSRVLVISDSENNKIDTIYEFKNLDKYYHEDVLEIYATRYDNTDALAISVNI